MLRFLVAGLREVDAGKTTVARALLLLMRELGVNACGFKPMAANMLWYDYDVVYEALNQGRLYGKDAKLLRDASGTSFTEEVISPVHRLWATPPHHIINDLATLPFFIVDRVTLPHSKAGEMVVVNDFAIVTRYLGDKLRRFLGDGSKYGVEIEYAKNRHWRTGNGVSVYRARRFLKEKFVLLMSDHIFNPKIITSLKKCRSDNDECILCVDRGLNYVFDIEDATKVKVIKNRIVQIGKNLRKYNGADMGIFLCTPYIFKILKRNIRKNRYSLTSAIRELARERKMRAYCIENEEYYWIDIDTFESLEIAERILSTHNQAFCLPVEKLNPKLSSIFRFEKRKTFFLTD